MTHEDDATYLVRVRRDPEDARFWLADVDGLDGAHTSSRSLATLDRYVREVIVLSADLPDGAEAVLTLEWTYVTGDADADRRAEALRRRRTEIDEASRKLMEETVELARQWVTRDGFSVREVATLLRLSPARVDQLIQAPKRKRGDAA